MTRFDIVMASLLTVAFIGELCAVTLFVVLNVRDRNGPDRAQFKRGGL